MLMDTGKHSHVWLFLFVLLNDLCSLQGVTKTFNNNMTSRSQLDDDMSFTTTKRVEQKQAFLRGYRAKNIVDDRLALVKEALKLVRRRRNALRITGKKLSETNPKVLLRRNRREAKSVNNLDDDEHVLDKRQIVSDNTKQNANLNDEDLRQTAAAHKLDKRHLPDFEEPALRTHQRKYPRTGLRGPETKHRRVKKDLDQPITMSQALQDFPNLPITNILKIILPLLKGRDGRDGRDGKNGRDGQRGDPGYPGPPGPPGAKGDTGDSGDCNKNKLEESNMRKQIWGLGLKQVKPSAHLTAGARHVKFSDGEEFKWWSSLLGTAHMVEGMESKLNQTIEIPMTGRYFVYCQLYISRLDSSGTKSGFQVTANDNTLLTSNFVNGGETSYLGAVFLLKERDCLKVRLKGSGIIAGDYTTNFFGAYLL